MAARKLKKDLPEVKRVKVLKPFRVVHDGTAYSGDDIAEVPAEVAAEWLRQGWADEV
jgi:hypothetical protein